MKRISVSGERCRTQNTKTKAFTLIEVIISVAITAILGGVVAILVTSIVESWQYTENRLELQKASSDIMNQLIQGGFDANGIRDAVDFISCGTDSMTFIPLWVDGTHKPDPITNKEQKFTLNRQFKVGSSVPLAQHKKADSTDWTTASVKFQYGEGTDPNNLDDVVQVLDPIPRGAGLKFTFTPDPTADPNTQKSFTYNQQDKHIYKTYKAETEDILKTMSQTRVETLRFIYFDNLNQQISPASEGYLSPNQLKRATAVKVYIVLSRKSDWREAASYINIRNISGVGVSIVQGSVVPLPSSKRIKALSIGNFFNRKREGIVRLVIKPENYRHWVVQLKITLDPSSPERLKVEKFQMEFPPGRTATSGFLNQPFMVTEFVNLLSLDRTGLYDYNDDEDINDFYLVTEEPVMMEVERLDFAGASLFVKP